MAQNEYQNTDCTVYVGELDQLVQEAILWELMLQAGPVVAVNIPKDKVSNQHMGFGFVEFASEIDADYAIKVMNMVKLYGTPIRLSKATRGTPQRTSTDVGANLFVGNLDPLVDEKMLYDVFSAFGFIINTPKVMRDPDSTNVTKNFGFVSYDSFEASDAAIQAMNGQFLMNRPISVTYAFKKDSKNERHGTAAERILAAGAKRVATHTRFAAAPVMTPHVMAVATAPVSGPPGISVAPPPGINTGPATAPQVIPGSSMPIRQPQAPWGAPMSMPPPGFPGGPPAMPMGAAPWAGRGVAPPGFGMPPPGFRPPGPPPGWAPGGPPPFNFQPPPPGMSSPGEAIPAPPGVTAPSQQQMPHGVPLPQQPIL